MQNKLIGQWISSMYAHNQMQAQMASISKGSQVSDLPQSIQNVFWELGEMHYEKPDKYKTNVTYKDGKGKDRAFNANERGNLGYYQHLIRTAAAEGDMGKVLEHAQNAQSFIGKTLINRVDRELEHVKETEMPKIHKVQSETFHQHVSTAIPLKSEINSFKEAITQTNETLFEGLYESLETRQGELSDEMVDRQHSELVPLVEDITIEHKLDGVSRLLTYSQDLSTHADTVYEQSLSQQIVSSDETFVPRQVEETPMPSHPTTSEEPLDDLIDKANSNTDESRIAQVAVLEAHSVELTSSRDGDPSGSDAWSDMGVQNAYLSVMDTASAFHRIYMDGNLAPYVDPLGNTPSEIGATLFRYILGRTQLRLSDTLRAIIKNNDGSSEEVDITWSAQTGLGSDDNGRYNLITIFTNQIVRDALGNITDIDNRDQFNKPWFRFNLVHEYGHILNQRVKSSSVILLDKHMTNPDFSHNTGVIVNDEYIWERSPLGWGDSKVALSDDYRIVFGQQNTYPSANEEWGDMFMYWVYDAFTDDWAGDIRQSFMHNYLPDILNTAYRRNLDPNTLVNIVLGWDTNANPLPTTTVITDGRNLNHYTTDLASNPSGALLPGTDMTIVGRNELGTRVLVITDTVIEWVDAEHLKANNPDVSIRSLRPVSQTNANALQCDITASSPLD